MTVITDRAFIIHSRSFGETSIIFDFLTEENGLISAVLKGAKKRKDVSQLQPSRELIISTSKANLPSLIKYELSEPYTIKKKYILLIVYFNELIYRLVPKHQPQKTLFNFYRDYISYMSSTDDHQDSVIIGFEILLLKNIGYAVTSEIPIPLIDDNYIFYYDKLQGFKQTNDHYQGCKISGKDLKLILNFDINSIQEKGIVRMITKDIIANIANPKTIKSFDII